MHLAVVNLQSFAQLTANGILRGSAIGLLGVAFALILYALSAYLAAREVEHDLMVFPGSSHDFTSKVTRAAREFVADRCRGEELPPLIGEVVVTAVLEGSPAAEAGLRAGDVLLCYNGRTVKTRDDYSQAQSTLVWGQEEAVITWRRGELEIDATVAVGRLGLTLEDR